MLKRAVLVVLAVLFAVGVYANWPEAGPAHLGQADVVVIYKAERRMTLMQAGAELKSYVVSLGRNPVGPKSQEGDGRTPEGLYAIDYRKPDSAYYKALHISYPSLTDLSAARQRAVDPGGLIMIHGMRNGLGLVGRLHRLIDWTEGCIAVTNREMDEIWNAVRDGTPVEIRP
ncbi:MAG: L,D-transpeptidase family protein [Burkholderiaceae bacterium]